MSVEIINLECPHCGSAISTQQKTCEYCNKPILIVDYSSVQSMTLPEVNKCANAYRKVLAEHPENQDFNISIGLCYLRLKLYDKSLEAFEKCMSDNFDKPDVFFYAAVALLKGQKAFLAPRAAIDKCVEYLNAALLIEPKGIYQYFLAYIKYDYFKRKYLRVVPDWQETLASAYTEYGATDTEATALFQLLGITQPEGFQ